MTPIRYAVLRDNVIDFLFAYCPLLLEDDFLLEGVIYFMMAEIRASVEEEREKFFENLRKPCNS